MEEFNRHVCDRPGGGLTEKSQAAFAAVREAEIGPLRYLVQRSDLVTLGVTADIERTRQIGRS
jgi:hypothetical protein